MGTHSPTEDMGVKLNISLLLSLASLAAATSPQEDMSEGRLLFSNYTSGLLALMPVNSTTYVTLTSVRRKREAVEDAGETNMVERMMDMYQAIIESEECLERVACDVGGLANDAGFDPTMA